MSRLNRIRHDPDKARVVGKPARSTPGLFQQAVDGYKSVSNQRAVITGVLLVAVVGAAAYSIGSPPLNAMTLLAVLLLAGHATLRFPAIAATTAVVAVSSVLAIPFAQIYAAAASGPYADMTGAIATLTATMALAGLVAHRTSRGRPWVTTLLVAAAVMFVGPFFLVIAPWLGFAWAWTVTAVVLFLRGGGWAWMVDQFTALTDIAARHRDKTATTLRNTPDASTQSAEALTAALLATLPAGYTVFHDRRLTSGARLNHLVVGPTGVFLVESRQFKGRVVEDPTHGLTHHTMAIADFLNDTDAAAGMLRRGLRLKEVHVYPVAVIHDAVLPSNRSLVALSSGDDTLGVVTVVGPSALVSHITASNVILSERQVRRVLARLARACPPASNKAVPATGLSTLPVHVVLLNEDGTPKTVPVTDAAQPMFTSSDSGLQVTVGQSVTVLTDQGSFSGYKVSGEPQPNDIGIICVPVCRSDAPSVVGAGPATDALVTETWFPLDSVQPA
jgi:hypothetical protein